MSDFSPEGSTYCTGRAAADPAPAAVAGANANWLGSATCWDRAAFQLALLPFLLLAGWQRLHNAVCSLVLLTLLVTAAQGGDSLAQALPPRPHAGATERPGFRHAERPHRLDPCCSGACCSAPLPTSKPGRGMGPALLLAASGWAGLRLPRRALYLRTWQPARVSVPCCWRCAPPWRQLAQRQAPGSLAVAGQRPGGWLTQPAALAGSRHVHPCWYRQSATTRTTPSPAPMPHLLAPGGRPAHRRAVRALC